MGRSTVDKEPSIRLEIDAPDDTLSPNLRILVLREAGAAIASFNDHVESAVLLDTSADDYLAPSQACINPAFASSSSTTQAPQSSGKVQPRSRRRRKRGVVVGNKGTENTPSKPLPESSSSVETTTTLESALSLTTTKPSLSPVVAASIADCLACSGCVTLLE